MSNRQQRRARRFDNGGGSGLQVAGLGDRTFIDGPQLDRLFTNDPTAGAVPGRHLWVLMTVFRVNQQNPLAPNAMLDLENMLSAAGPLCIVCEQPYTAAVGADPCPGEPS